MAEETRPLFVGGAPALRGEIAGEGPPILLCHGLTATRRYVVHGSRVLERSGYSVVTYDARGHGESDPAPPGQGYGYPELVADLARVVGEALGEEQRFVLGGHSMGAHTAVGYALEQPERVAGLAIVGPAFQGPIGPESEAYWDGLAAALEEQGVDGFAEYIGREQGIAEPWREPVLRFTRQRIERHRDPGALAEALRQTPRSSPLGSLADLGRLEIPALVVGSRDEADPGHPLAVAEEYAEQLPQARLVVDAEGESPLAWQGGKLSREIAAFCAEIGYGGGDA